MPCWKPPSVESYARLVIKFGPCEDVQTYRPLLAKRNRDGAIYFVLVQSIETVPVSRVPIEDCHTAQGLHEAYFMPEVRSVRSG